MRTCRSFVIDFTVELASFCAVTYNNRCSTRNVFKSDRFLSQEMLDLMNKYGVQFLPAITVKRNL